MFVQLFFERYQCFSFLVAEFLLAAGFVFVLSIKLTIHADQLERSTGLSEIWIGGLLLAFVTSLPEAVNSIGSTFIQGAMNLGVGNLIGSNMFNIVVIVVLDIAQGPGPIMMLVKKSQIFMAAGGVLLMGVVGVTIALHIAAPGDGQLGPAAGIASSLIIFAIVVAVIRVFTHRDSKKRVVDPEREARVPDSSSLNLILRFAGHAGLIVLASVWMLRTCDAMARQPLVLGHPELVLGHTFVGAFLVAIATSLPELFVSLGALRLGRVNMSIANLFGSNVMNMAFIPIMHLFVFHAGFYAEVSPDILGLFVAAIIMSLLFIAGLFSNSKRSLLFLGRETTLILLVYIVATVLAFRAGVL